MESLFRDLGECIDDYASVYLVDKDKNGVIEECLHNAKAIIIEIIRKRFHGALPELARETCFEKKRKLQ